MGEVVFDVVEIASEILTRKSSGQKLKNSLPFPTVSNTLEH